MAAFCEKGLDILINMYTTIASKDAKCHYKETHLALNILKI